MRPASWTRAWMYCLATFLVLFGSWAARAQTERATLEGTVTDPSGAVIVGAKVQITDLATGETQQKVTNRVGAYRFPATQIGSYRVSVSYQGFKTETVGNVDLHVGETRTLDVKLSVGTPQEIVEVKAQTIPFERSSAESGDVILGKQLNDLPVNGRSWSTLSVLAPFAQDDGGGDARTIRFAGRAKDDNTFSFDGVDASGIQEQAQKSEVRLQISEDAIAEFRVSSALYTAEYGSQSGGQVNVVTKSGTNEFHGTAFGYLRNSAFDARAFVDPAQIPPFRFGQYGLTLGGPIKKDKTFFFLSYEGLRQLQGNTLTAFVPDSTIQRQILVTGNPSNMGPSGPSPEMCIILQAFPWRQSTGTITTSNGQTCAPHFVFPDSAFTDLGGGTDQFVHQANSIIHEDSWLIRLDHHFSDKTTFYGRAQRDISLVTAPLGNDLDQQGIFNHPGNYLLALVHVFSANVVNEAKFGINRSPFHNPNLSNLRLNGNCLDVQTPSWEEVNNCATDNEVGTTFSYIDNLTMIHGRHTFKTGIEIRRIRLNQGITADDIISYATPATGNDVNQNVESNTLDTLDYRSSWSDHALRRTFFLPFFQDEWKVTPTFTVNLGLRWEYYGVATEARNRTAVFDLQDPNFTNLAAGTGGVCLGSGDAGNPIYAPLELPSCPRNPALYFPNYRNWDPRVSFAWAPPLFHAKTVIRSGFGIYHGSAQNDDLNGALESDNIRVQATSADFANPATFKFNPNTFFDQPFPPGLATTPLPEPRALIRQNRRDLYVEEWGLTIDQSLPGNFLFSSSYLGSHGVRLFSKLGENICTTNVLTCVRPLPGFGFVDAKQDVGTSTYHALQLSLQHRYASGFSFQTNYTYSHSINDGSVGGGEANRPENLLCRLCDVGPSVFDIRHNVVVNSIYELPFGPGKSHLNVSGFLGKVVGGWSLSGLGNYHTGHPLTVLFSPDSSVLPFGDTSSDQRPDIVPGVSLTPPGGATPNLFINPAAFAPPPIDPTTGLLTHFGNAGRGLVRAPSVWAIDMSLAKTTKLTERLGLQARMDVFNVFNHTQFGDPSDLDIGDFPGGFGIIRTTVNFNNNNDNFAGTNTGTGVPRQFQFSLRFIF